MLNNKSIKIISYGVLVYAALLYFGEAAESTASEKQILAQVGDEILTLKDFNSEIEALPEEIRVQVTDKVKEEVVKKWIRTQLFSQEAKRRGIDRKEDIQKRVEEFKKDLLTKELIRDELEKQKITDDDLKKYYDEHKADYTVPVLEDKKLSGVMNFTEVKEKIREKLLAGKVKDIVEKLENELENKSKVIRNLELLNTTP